MAVFIINARIRLNYEINNMRLFLLASVLKLHHVILGW